MELVIRMQIGICQLDQNNYLQTTINPWILLMFKMCQIMSLDLEFHTSFQVETKKLLHTHPEHLHAQMAITARSLCLL